MNTYNTYIKYFPTRKVLGKNLVKFSKKQKVKLKIK